MTPVDATGGPEKGRRGGPATAALSGPELERAAAALFAELVELSPEQRGERLARESDPGVVARANALLAADADSAALLAEPWLTSWSAISPGLGAGDLLGPWRLEELIGQGGSSVVFRATRADGAFTRRVAIKVLKFGFQSADERRRLARERRILAAFDHPGIARLLDGGTTEDGLPWFAVELIEGVELREYLSRGEAGALSDKLEIAAQLARALAAAHAKGIVHRDLKPENVMVERAAGDREPRVRMLDFGLAHALEWEAPEDAAAATEPTAGEADTARREPSASVSLFRTAHGHLIGTIPYMSPEQARGEAATPASDVYSLGLVLRELVTGRRAYPVGATFEEIHRRAIAGELEPLPAGVGRDLRTLLSRMLVADPTARPTAAAVADRLGDLLARPQRRRRWLLTAAAALVVTAVAAKVGLDLRQERLASREAKRAEEIARQSSEDLARFLDEVYRTSDPRNSPSETVSARAILDHGAERLAHDLADQPLVQARLLGSIGGVYCRLGVYDRAEELLRGSLATRQAALPADHPEVIASETELASCLQEIGELPESETLLLRALGALERTAPGVATRQVGEVLNKLGSVRFMRGDIPGARLYFERALRVCERAAGLHSPEVAEQLNDLALVLMNEGRMQEAQPLMERSVAIVEEHHPDGDAVLGTALNNLAGLEVGLGLFEQAEQRFLRALAMRRRVLGPAHPDVAGTMVNLAFLYDDLEREVEAEPLYQEAIAILDEALGPDSQRLAIGLRRYADCLADMGVDERAGPLYERAIGMFERTVGPNHYFLAPALGGLARVRARSGELAAARGLAERGLAVNVAGFGPDHPLSVELRELLAGLGTS